MDFEVITSRHALPIEQLKGLDASFSTSTVYDVVTTDHGFTLVETSLAEPFMKRYTLLDDLTDDELPWDTAVLARSGEGLRGIAATSYARWNRRQILSELHVAPGHRRRGLARALLDTVRSTARENGARELWLETQSHNFPAITAYRSLGFRLTGIDTTRYAAPHDGETAVFMSQPV